MDVTNFPRTCALAQNNNRRSLQFRTSPPGRILYMQQVNDKVEICNYNKFCNKAVLAIINNKQAGK